MADWRGVILGDVAELLVGYAFKSTEFSKDLKVSRLLRGINIGQGYLDWSATSYWPEEGSHSRYALHCGDVILAMDRPWIEAGLKRARVRERDLPALLVQRVARIRGTGAASTSYLYHIISSPHFCEYARSSATGTTVPHISESQIARYQFRLPSQQDQDRICHLLDGIDDLIENNRRRIELLEQMAQAIYREWFVRFRYPGHEGIPLVDSPLGQIPEGWAVKGLFEVADIGFGYSFKSRRFAAAGPYPVVRIRDLQRGFTKTFSDEETTSRYRVVDDDILVGMDGDFHIRQWTSGDAWLNQRVTRIRPLGGMAPRHLRLAIEQPIKEWNSVIIGTTVAHLGKSHLEKIQISVPSKDTLALASRVFGSISCEERLLMQQSRQLASLRDLLLPRLVTGKIDVSKLDLDAVLEGATA